MNRVSTSGLEQIEKQAYQTIWEDGLIDIFVGLSVFLIGVFWVSQGSVYGSVIAPIFVPFWVVARKRISEPRVGVVNFSAERINKENKKLLGLVLLGVLTLVIGVAWYFFGSHISSLATPQHTNLVAGLPAALLAIPSVIVALTFSAKRFFVYAAVMLMAAVPVIVFDLNPGWAFIPGGVWCMAVGGGLLMRFVRKHPIGR